MKWWDLDTQHCFKTMVGHRSEVSVGNSVYTVGSFAETSDSINLSIVLLENIVALGILLIVFVIGLRKVI